MTPAAPSHHLLAAAPLEAGAAQPATPSLCRLPEARP